MSRKIESVAEAVEVLSDFEKKMEGWRGEQPRRAATVAVPSEEKVDVMSIRKLQRHFLARKALDFNAATRVRPESHSYALFAMTKESKAASQMVVSRAAHQDLVDALNDADPYAPIMSHPKLPEVALGAFSRDLITRHQLVTILQNWDCDNVYGGGVRLDRPTDILEPLLSAGLPTRLISGGELTEEAVELVKEVHDNLNESVERTVDLETMLHNFKMLLSAMPESEQACRMRLHPSDDEPFEDFVGTYKRFYPAPSWLSYEESGRAKLDARFEGLNMKQYDDDSDQIFELDYMLSAGAHDTLMMAAFGDDFVPNYPVFGIIPARDVLSGAEHGFSVRPSQAPYPGTHPPESVHRQPIKRFRQNTLHDYAHSVMQSAGKRAGQLAKGKMLLLLRDYMACSAYPMSTMQWMIGDEFGIDPSFFYSRGEKLTVPSHFNTFFSNKAIKRLFRRTREDRDYTVTEPIESALFSSESSGELSDFAILLACDFVLHADEWAALGVTKESLAVGDGAEDKDRLMLDLHTKAFAVMSSEDGMTELAFKGRSKLHQVLLFRCLQNYPGDDVMFGRFAMRINELSTEQLQELVEIKRDNRCMLLTIVDAETKQPLYHPEAFSHLIERLELSAAWAGCGNL